MRNTGNRQYKLTQIRWKKFAYPKALTTKMRPVKQKKKAA